MALTALAPAWNAWSDEETAKANEPMMAVPVEAKDAAPVQPNDAARHAQHEDLAAKIQNPFADLITFPFQNISTFGYGPENGGQNILNVQPVVPLHLNKGWKLLMRPILPVSYTSWPSSDAGLGDVNFEPFLSPVTASKLVWGVGSVLGIPTATSDFLGTGNGPPAPRSRFLECMVTGPSRSSPINSGPTPGTALVTRSTCSNCSPA